MSTQETELPDCQEKGGLKRKLTGPPRLLLGKSKSKEKAVSQRSQRREKCFKDTPENIDKQPDSHHSPQKETEEMKNQQDAQGDTILVTLEESQGKEVNNENKTGMSRTTSKATIKRTFSSLICSGRRRKEAETHHNSNTRETTKISSRNKAQTNMHENKQCGANYKAVAQEKGKRNFFFMVCPISKRSSSDINQGRQCRERGSSMLLQETPPKDSFKKKIYCIFRRRKKAHPPDDHNEYGPSKTTYIEIASDQLNQFNTDNTDIPSTPKQDHLKKEQEIEKRASETFTFSAEVSVNTNIESGHIDDDQEPDQIILSTTNGEKHAALESTNVILQTSELLNSCCFDSGLPGTSNASQDTQAKKDAHQKESDKNYVKCRPVITIDRVYTPEEENQESHVNEASHFDFLSMNGSWQHLQINSFKNNTLHPSDMSLSPELDHGRCNETILIQTAVSMVQTAIRGAVELLTNEQQQNQISLDSV
ncbi:hypothetical protein E1301_Tti008145 [Triplophysa tibetana]|uniref:Uncharacterized protein n=1 Tax=Triplophysa tibetana TaxID=1572043 RepID=A0A5A9NIC9_9TELE|nr:hypothetical protein E1301_Tti008145 [Triplophysa tibetana]